MRPNHRTATKLRPGLLVLLLVVLAMAYWSTGRADQALAPLGLNVHTCYQALGTTYCGENADRFANRRGL